MSAAGCVFVTVKVASKIVVNYWTSTSTLVLDTSATFDSLLMNVLNIEDVVIEDFQGESQRCRVHAECP